MFLGNNGFSFLIGLILSAVAAYYAYRWAPNKNQNAVFWAIGCFIVPIALIVLYFLPQGGGAAPVGQTDPWMASVSHLRFHHYYKGYGIAIDPDNRKMYLRTLHLGKYREGAYAFDDVREWNSNVASGGHVQTYGNVGVSAAVGVAAANLRQTRENEAQSGLFIKVRDIDMPEWRIAFKPSRERSHELTRWMEILRQNLNEGVSV